MNGAKHEKKPDGIISHAKVQRGNSKHEALILNKSEALKLEYPNEMDAGFHPTNGGQASPA
jgi:hypothetical protein